MNDEATTVQIDAGRVIELLRAQLDDVNYRLALATARAEQAEAEVAQLKAA